VFCPRFLGSCSWLRAIFRKQTETLAEVYRVMGEKELAREEIQRYLAADNSANKAAVEFAVLLRGKQTNL
jgi:hypothetical protein